MGEVHGPVPDKVWLCLCFKIHQALGFLLFLRTTHPSCMEASVCCRGWKAAEKEGEKYTPHAGEEYIFPPLSSSPSWSEWRDLWWIQYPGTRERGRIGSGTVELELGGLVWLSWGYHPGAQAAQCYPCLVMLVTCAFRISVLTQCYSIYTYLEVDLFLFQVLSSKSNTSILHLLQYWLLTNICSCQWGRNR